MKEKTKIIWLIIVGLICGTILWVFTSSLKKDNSPIMEGASIEEYEQQTFEEIPEEKEPPKKEESPIDFNNYKPIRIIVYQHGSVDGQPYIDESYAIAEDTAIKESRKVTETPEKMTDSYSFSLSSGESKTVKSGNTTISVTYGDKKKTNYLMSINGIKVNRYGEFEIAIDGILYHIKGISLKCPNPDCRRHTFCSDCNFQFTKDEKSHAECNVCHSLFKYENSIDDFFFNCPECGNGDCTTFKSCSYCRNCGRNLAEDKERLLNYSWESR